ncbi:hypothetical protein HMPREF0240_02482 [Clostridium sp. D5]|nr:hypothetical protein HMPREF0240_02482 [Clostridium sp. D5]
MLRCDRRRREFCKLKAIQKAILYQKVLKI